MDDDSLFGNDVEEGPEASKSNNKKDHKHDDEGGKDAAGAACDAVSIKKNHADDEMYVLLIT